MSINYSLEPNHLTPDPNDQKARVVPNNVLTLEDIVKRILKRGTTLTEVDVRAVLLIAMEEIADAVVEGNNVNTPLINVKPSIQGVFKDVNDVFDAKRHTVNASVSLGTQFAEKIVGASVVKNASASAIAPDIVSFKDVRTTSSTIATKGGIAAITGTELKYDMANASEGIFFINTTTAAETKVTDVAQHTATNLMFLVPTTLVAGNYFVEVRKAYTKNTIIRSDRYDFQIVVN